MIATGDVCTAIEAMRLCGLSLYNHLSAYSNPFQSYPQIPLFQSIPALRAHPNLLFVQSRSTLFRSFFRLLFKLLIKNFSALLSLIPLTLAINIFDCCLTNFLCFFRRTAWDALFERALLYWAPLSNRRTCQTTARELAGRFYRWTSILDFGLFR